MALIGRSIHERRRSRDVCLPAGVSTLFILMLCIVGTSHAQQRLSADVTTRQVVKNKVLRIERQLFYTAGGDMVTHYTYPQEYYMRSNQLGEVVVYQPTTNEVALFNDKSMAEQSEIMLQFLSPDRANLNLTRLGFVLQKTERQGKRIVKTFTPTMIEDKIYSKVVLVMENNRPIYCAFYDKNATIVKKTFYSNYTTLPTLSFPTRITQISYNTLGDSTIRKEEYKNIKTSGFAADAPFQFRVPSNAKRVNPFDFKR